MNTKWMKSSLNSKTYTCFERASSDRIIVRAKICVSQYRKKKNYEKLHELTGPHLPTAI